MTTIMNQECVHEEVEYDGDLVSGSFVVIDHGLAWNDEPGVELVVRKSKKSSFLPLSQTSSRAGRTKCICCFGVVIKTEYVFLEESSVEMAGPLRVCHKCAIALKLYLLVLFYALRSHRGYDCFYRIRF